MDSTVPATSSHRFARAPSDLGTGSPAPSRSLRTLRYVVGAASVILAIGLLLYFSRLVAYLVVGALLAYFLRPLVDRIQAFGLGRIVAILLAYLLVVMVLTIAVRSLVPFAVGQISDLSTQVSVEQLSRVATSIETKLAGLPGLQEGSISVALTDAFETLFAVDRLARFFSFVLSLFTNLFYALLVVPFVTFFFLKDGPQIRRGLMGIVPNRYFEVALGVVSKIERNIGSYLRGLAAQSLSIGTLAFILLYIVGLDYALVVGVFAGLANTIPYFGPLVGFLAGALVGITQTGDFSLIPGVVIAMGLTQAADNVFFQPFIFSRVAKAHPLVILFVVLVGAQLAGIVGMLVAIPLLTTVRVSFQQIVWSVRNYGIVRS